MATVRNFYYNYFMLHSQKYTLPFDCLEGLLIYTIRDCAVNYKVPDGGN